ncbi:protein LTO1 homolog isoform X4 [Falco peregrinus]|uniref:protein LTO1 homolog isoform X4 n=1 Tax=Falco peregrinus TaxID=8954 RepID=UPI0024785B8B|nr:protein LTO1 homolog isoform X4 [Falco peregrinus]
MAAVAAGTDMFDEIVMAEERFHSEGYQEGYAEGSHAGVVEGRRYGSLHGAKIGSEVGYYLGFALTWQCLLQKCTDEKNSKKMRALDLLVGMIQKFPYEDPTYDKLQEDLEKIRGKFKQVDTKLVTARVLKPLQSRRLLTFLSMACDVLKSQF